MRRSKVARTGGAVEDIRPDLKLTHEDYLHFPNDGKRHEIIDGEHYVTAAPSTRHQRIVVRLTGFLLDSIRQSGRGELLLAPIDVVLSETDVVQPDLLFVAADRLERITEPDVQGAPDLVVEVLSPSTRKTDEVIKRKRYQLFGVREYWVVDPELDTVKVYRLGSTGFGPAEELSAESGDTLTTPLLPGLAIPLAKVFP